LNVILETAEAFARNERKTRKSFLSKVERLAAVAGKVPAVPVFTLKLSDFVGANSRPLVEFQSARAPQLWATELAPPRVARVK